MTNKDFLQKAIEGTKALGDLKSHKETVWINPDINKAKYDGLKMDDINDAEQRLLRFAPFIMHYFKDTHDKNGLIESELCEISAMKALLNSKYSSGVIGKLLLKMDSHLPIAGSVKARGGIYEVLKHTEDLALEHGFIDQNDDYSKLASDECRNFFKDYSVHVGSTGNLGMSIGIMSAVIGYKAVVHMSADAKKWKKDYLRSYGVNVIEYQSDYSEAVKNGRAESDQDPKSYFVDDENSKNLFLGYAVAAKRLVSQLEENKVMVDEAHPLFVYIPCGVGGAPGGVTFGLKELFGKFVHCFFVEPVNAPCMLAGMATGLNSDISVQDLGLSGQTHADGLAVGRASGFVGDVMKGLLSGIFTVHDSKLYDYMRDIIEAEDIFLEPSACAAFEGVVKLNKYADIIQYIRDNELEGKMENSSHIIWATGGRLVPEKEREKYRNTHL